MAVETGYEIARHSTGVDAAVVVQVHRAIERKPVPCHPAFGCDSNRHDLLPVDPHTRVAIVSSSVDAEGCQALNHAALEPAEEAVEVVPVVGKSEHGVADQLARSVEGNVAASRHRDNRNALRVKNVRRCPSGSTHGIHRVVFTKDERVWVGPGDAVGEYNLHAPDSLFVGDPAPVDHPQLSASMVD